MSADNWGKCPLCESKKAQALKNLKEQYGKISQEEYEDLKEELESNEDDDEYEDGDTLREDYEVGVDKKGYAYINYCGSCQKCGATWEINQKDILPNDSEDIELVKKLNKK